MHHGVWLPLKTMNFNLFFLHNASLHTHIPKLVRSSVLWREMRVFISPPSHKMETNMYYTSLN
eukprot:c14606_g1_i1 orf=77-265(+)